MTTKIAYSIMQDKLDILKDNINDCLNEFQIISNKLHDAISVNDNYFYGDLINSSKNSLQKEKNLINNEFLPEVKKMIETS